MSNNYIQNLNIIKNDYYKCIGTWENCKTIYKELSKKSNNIKENTEDYNIYQAQIEDLISNLGKVGEKSLKYIIGLEYIRINPNADKEALNNIFIKKNTLKDFIIRHNINATDNKLIELMNYEDLNKQKAHNFDYWYSALELSLPHIIKNINELFYNTLQSEWIYEEYKDSLIEKFNNNYDLSPNTYKKPSKYLFSIIFPDMLTNIPDSEIEFYGGIKNTICDNELLEKRNKIKECGDAFTRYRYASNNPDNKKVPLNELMKIIEIFVLYITFIHNNNDNLYLDISETYSKYQCIKYKDLLNSSDEDIEKIYKYYIVDCIDLAELLYTKFTFQEIAKMIDLEVTKQDLIYKIENSNLTSGLIKYYKSIGITNYKEMEELYEEYLNNSQYTSQKPKLKTRIK